MRGKVLRVFLAVVRDRITPAYAGKSDIVQLSDCVCGDHPRLCGEKLTSHARKTAFQGSPPPMRGKVTVQCDAMDHGGITPAYAGKRRKRNSIF